MIRKFQTRDESELQRLTRQTMPGWIRLAYCNSPSYIAGENLKGDEVSVFVIEDGQGRLGGCGTCAVKNVRLNGARERIGYLAGLRSFDFARNKMGLFKAYQWVRECGQRDPLPLYITTIVSANLPARELLTSRRAKLPAYLEAGEIVTFGATSRAIKRRYCVAKDYAVANGATVGEARLRAFYNEAPPRRELFPLLPDPLPAGLDWGDFVVLEKDGEIVAAAALWNQQPVRQIHVASYHPFLAMARPLVNPILRMLGYFPLPPPRTDMDCLFLAYCLPRHESPAEFESLLAASASRIGKRILFFALHERDPFLPAARNLTAWHYRSMLYTVSFAPNPAPFVFHQPPYIELATL